MTRDCSTRISREHYISKSILEELPSILVSGFRWQPPGQQKQLSVNAMTAKIFCTRHNSALAPLDTLALGAFRALVAAPEYATTRLNPGKSAHYLISGDALELWMIKLLCGIYFGGIGSADGVAVRDSGSIDNKAIVQALTNKLIRKRAGLYLAQGVGEMAKKVVSVAPMIDTTSGDTVGVVVEFGTLRFETALVPLPERDFRNMVEAGRYRPGVIDFVGPARDARIAVTWRNQGNNINRFGIEIESGSS